MITAQSILDESWKAPRRMRNALRLCRGELWPELAATPAEEVASWWRVTRY